MEKLWNVLADSGVFGVFSNGVTEYIINSCFGEFYLMLIINKTTDVFLVRGSSGLGLRDVKKGRLLYGPWGSLLGIPKKGMLGDRF